jgi:hypothetical protein
MGRRFVKDNLSKNDKYLEGRFAFLFLYVRAEQAAEKGRTGGETRPLSG